MNRAYTLMEVLAAIVIVFLLLILLSTGLTHSKVKASQAACLANEHQLASGMALYVQDYDGHFPRVDSREASIEQRVWTVAIRSYSGVIKSCPDCSRPGELAATWANSVTTGYALNENRNNFDASPGASSGKYVGHNEAIVQYPALTVEIFDARACMISIDKPDLNSNDGEGTYCKQYISLIVNETEGARRHSSGANYTFADGHNKWYLPEQLDTSVKSTGTRAGFGL